MRASNHHRSQSSVLASSEADLPVETAMDSDAASAGGGPSAALGALAPRPRRRRARPGASPPARRRGTARGGATHHRARAAISSCTDDAGFAKRSSRATWKDPLCATKRATSSSSNQLRRRRRPWRTLGGAHSAHSHHTPRFVTPAIAMVRRAIDPGSIPRDRPCGSARGIARRRDHLRSFDLDGDRFSPTSRASLAFAAVPCRRALACTTRRRPTPPPSLTRDPPSRRPTPLAPRRAAGARLPGGAENPQGRGPGNLPARAEGEAPSGAFYTLVPIRPRWRGERRSLRTFAVVSLRPHLAFNPRPRRLSTQTDAFELHPDIASYGTTVRSEGSSSSRPKTSRPRP